MVSSEYDTVRVRSTGAIILQPEDQNCKRKKQMGARLRTIYKEMQNVGPSRFLTWTAAGVIILTTIILKISRMSILIILITALVIMAILIITILEVITLIVTIPKIPMLITAVLILIIGNDKTDNTY